MIEDVIKIFIYALVIVSWIVCTLPLLAFILFVLSLFN